MNAQPSSPIRRTDRTGEGADLTSELRNLRKPLAGDIALSQITNTLVREGELYETLPNGKVHCYACAHDCTISPGGRGVCQVRYNIGGKLYVPWGYVAALQCAPTEKKPFFHVYPGSDTVTFGMLGCDMHCPYCFTGDTVVVTERGPMKFEEVFQAAGQVERRPDGEIAYPDSLRTVAGSGTWRSVRKVFKHPYKGQLAVIRPYYLPELRCTTDHRIYATDDPEREPVQIYARELTRRHYLAVPRSYDFTAFVEVRGSRQRILESANFYLVPVRDVTFMDYEGDVYNMEVEIEHNYLAGFFLVSNCQNWDISQALRDAYAGHPPYQVTPQQIVEAAQGAEAKCVASSYNEPLITSEWAVEVFKAAKAAGLTCLYISNGNATREALEYIRPYVSAYKVDLKSMRANNYRTLGAVLDHILDGIRLIHEMGFWLEIVTLVVPGFNDSDEELRDAAEFIKSVSPDIPWHVTAFHKDYKMRDPENTDAKTLQRAAEIGRAAGLRYVYAGNLPGRVGNYEHTYCPTCETLLVERMGYIVMGNRIMGEGKCPACGTRIPGIWA